MTHSSSLVFSSMCHSFACYTRGRSLGGIEYQFPSSSPLGLPSGVSSGQRREMGRGQRGYYAVGTVALGDIHPGICMHLNGKQDAVGNSQLRPCWTDERWRYRKTECRRTKDLGYFGLLSCCHGHNEESNPKGCRAHIPTLSVPSVCTMLDKKQARGSIILSSTFSLLHTLFVMQET